MTIQDRQNSTLNQCLPWNRTVWIGRLTVECWPLPAKTLDHLSTLQSQLCMAVPIPNWDSGPCAMTRSRSSAAMTAGSPLKMQPSNTLSSSIHRWMLEARVSLVCRLATHLSGLEATAEFLINDFCLGQLFGYWSLMTSSRRWRPVLDGRRDCRVA